MYRDGETTYVLLPKSRLQHHDLLCIHILPRRHRDAAKSAVDTPIAQGLIEASKDRTRRLLRSVNELEREVCGNALESYIQTPLSKIDADPHWFTIDDFGREWWESWKKALERAGRVQVRENILTEEFREARSIGLGWDPSCDPLDKRWDVAYNKSNWGYYQLRRGSRHKWGQYLRSSMAWDWDLGSCMKRLFSVKKHNRSGPSTTLSPAIDVGSTPGETWKISAGHVHAMLPKEVRISLKTEDGETQYMSFLPATRGPGCCINAEIASDKYSADEMSDTLAVQQGWGCRRGSSDGKREAKSSSCDTAHTETQKEALIEELDDVFEGKYVRFDEGHSGGDAISICSLD